MGFEFDKYSHREYEGRHSVLSPSGYSWLNYDGEKMVNSWNNSKKREEGTYLHDLASKIIKTGIKVSPHVKKAFYMFINDAINYGMESEVLLFVSDNAFGTADAIHYDEVTRFLRIHDLKTGNGKPSFSQLDIYAAFFCIQYGIDPMTIHVEERLYQFDGFTVNEPTGEVIREIMDQIMYLDETIEFAKKNYGGVTI